MRKEFKELVDKINEKTKDIPLIYFSREAERAIGLEKYLENFHICCIEDNDIVDNLLEKGISIFCLEKEGVELLHKSTGNLLSQNQTKDWINKIKTNKGFYALTFIPTNTLNYKISNLGGRLLGNDYELHQIFENKIKAVSHLEGAKIRTPKNQKKYFHELTHEKIIEQFGDKFVLQEERAHTGSGTHFSISKDELENMSNEKAGNIVKISEYIEGIPMTVNVCIYNNSIYIGGLQYQITGIKELTSSVGATVGNDFDWFYSKEISDELLVDLTTEISKIGKMLIEQGYRGLFGLDLIIKEDEAYLIEINARQTSNIPFQTYLEIEHGNTIPQFLMHIAEFLDIHISFDYEHMINLKGSQVFLRADKDTHVKDHNFKSGIYRLQSDNSSKDWSDKHPTDKENVIYIDEEQDRPLIFKSNGYSIEDIEGAGFVINFQKPDSKKRKLDELCRFQFNYGIIDKQRSLPAWLSEAFKTIRNEV